MKNRVLIIGGGPAGMMSAYSASLNGSEVILLEHNDKIGKKMRITGKGRCNITNYSDIEDIIKNIYNNGNFMYSALYSLTNFDVLDLLKNYGLDTKIERGNRVFPLSDKAIDVVKTFEKMINNDNINLMLNADVKSILLDDEKKFIKGVILKNKKILYSNRVIIATGGMSYPLTGSTGKGYELAKLCGHSIVELKPSLVGLETIKKPTKEMVGLNLKNIKMSLCLHEKLIYSSFGELEFRDCGLDGPTIKSASCHLSAKKSGYSVFIDLKPALDFKKLDERLQRDFKNNNNSFFEKALNNLLPKKIINFILDESKINRKKIVHQITREERHRLVQLIKNVKMEIKCTRPMEEAIVTSGGVNTKEINPHTMESKLVKGLYFAGEVIDVDAYTGGYNLQIAYSTGYLAGVNASK